MAVWMLVVGGLMLLVVSYDVLSTTLVTTSAAGPLTGGIGHGVWAMSRRVARRPGSVIMQMTGPIVLVLTIVVWLTLLWGGWTLIFSAAPDAVISSADRQPADGWERLYFAGFTTFTLGVGDYIPNGPVWQVLTSVGVVSGLALTTMAITYLLPVVTAVTGRRTQANTIAGLGATPQDIAVAGWHRGSFEHLDLQLALLAPQILLTAERHLSYPILHFFHSAERNEDFRVQLFALDEAVTLLEAAVPEPAGPHPAALASVHHASSQLLQYVPLHTSGEVPAPLDLEPLRRAGIPTVDDATFAGRLDAARDHRRRLAAFAEESLWHQQM